MQNTMVWDKNTDTYFFRSIYKHLWWKNVIKNNIESHEFHK